MNYKLFYQNSQGKRQKKPEALESFLTCFHSLMLENSVSLKKSIVSLQKLLNKINKRGNDTWCGHT